jgi:protein-tyrosine phosphatase
MQLRTSLAYPLRIDWLDPPSRVGLTLAPGQHRDSTRGFRWARDLELDLQELKRQGVTMLVGLIEDSELSYNLSELYPRAAELGLAVKRLPIPDGGVPAQRSEVEALLTAIDAHEAAGGRIVIHCMGGLGRTGTIAGCYLARRGLPYETILSTLVRVRQDPLCPENDAQKRYIRSFCKPAAANSAGSDFAPAKQAASESRSWFETLFGPREGWPALAKRALGAGEQSKPAVAELVAAVEAEVSARGPAAFSFDEQGFATLQAAARSFAAGRFSTPSIAELRHRLPAKPQYPAKLSLAVLSGAHPLSDIGTLQATAGPNDVFQVASQFNGLEAPDACVVPVLDYLHDYTQGPRASISAFPGVLLRHYAAPLDRRGSRFVQTNAQQLNFLADVFEPQVAELRRGYLQGSAIRDKAALAQALLDRFEHARVGLHEDIEVVFGHDWSGPVVGHKTICQVLTSTIAQGSYGPDDGSEELAVVRRQLLRASYLGTLLAAVAVGKRRVVLTLIGGGVFSNPLSDIWQAIHWASEQAAAHLREPLQVVVNSRTPIFGAQREEVLSRGGQVIDLQR